MDDIRRPNPQRRDFALRNRGYAPRPAVPAQPAAQPAPQPSMPSVQSYEPAPAENYAAPAPLPQTPPVPQPIYNQPQPADYLSDLAPAPRDDTPYEHYTQPAPRPQPIAKKKLLPKIPVKYAVAGVAVLALISASAYMITRPAQTSGFSVAQLAKKSKFSFYYPEPLPQGYSYVAKINAFQDNQAYFMLAQGKNHIIFHEQPTGTTNNSQKISAPQTYKTSVGQATIGTLAGQPAAKLIVGSTEISVNTTGNVPSTDLIAALSHLKTTQ